MEICLKANLAKSTVTIMLLSFSVEPLSVPSNWVPQILLNSVLQF